MRKILLSFIVVLLSVCSYAANYLTFTAGAANATFQLTYTGTPTNAPVLQYSDDGGVTWNVMAYNTNYTILAGQSVYLKGNNPCISNSNSRTGLNAYYFAMTGSIEASGSIMSLLDGVGTSTTITEPFCFNSLFWNCTSLKTAPELPATTLSVGAYRSLFNASGITAMPELPALMVPDSAYFRMFINCTALTETNTIAANTIGYMGAARMFYGCTALQKAPVLSAMNLSAACYREMFYGCTSLQEAELPATSLADSCYESMFYNCSAFTKLTVGFMAWQSSKWLNPTTTWLSGVSSYGEFMCPNILPNIYGVSGIPTGWAKNPAPKLLRFKALKASTVSISKTGSPSAIVEYSLNNSTWQTLTGSAVALAIGQTMYLRGTNSTIATNTSNYMTFVFGAGSEIYASGSVMSLLDGEGTSTTISNQFCFYKLFNNCTLLKHAPELTATTLTNYCYAYMFYGCTGLTSTPELPAEELTDYCYWYMFANCSAITTFTSMSATSTAQFACDNMFRACSALTRVPAVLQATLSVACYRSMFYQCTTLRDVPQLPMTTLSSRCYEYMFYGCTALRIAPELPATTLVDNCYLSMFQGCSRLEKINVSFTEWHDNATTNWVNSVRNLGNFYGPVGLAKENGVNRIPIGWQTGSTNYLTLRNASSGNSTLKLTTTGSPGSTIQYSLDGSTWNTLTSTAVTVPYNQAIYLRGTNSYISRDASNYQQFVMTGWFEVSGPLSALLDGTGMTVPTVTQPYCFYRLFYNCTQLCYGSQFTIPFTSLPDYACYQMFYGCTGNNLYVPTLSATTLGEGAYMEMFYGCTQLETMSELPATTVGKKAYYQMFYNCAKLTKGPSVLPALTMPDSCCFGMFQNCTNLQIAPRLPATTLGAQTYRNMFCDCPALVDISDTLPALTIPSNCCRSMYNRCYALTEVPVILATSVATLGCAYMFQNTAISHSPHLLPTTLTDSCYAWMFNLCSNLSRIDVEFTSWAGTNSTLQWVQSVSATGTFIAPEALTDIRGVNNIPSGWLFNPAVVADLDSCLHFTAVAASSTICLKKTGSPSGWGKIEYSFDNITWTVLSTSPISVTAGRTIYIRGNNVTTVNNSTSSYLNFVMTGSFRAGGSIMSLLDGTGDTGLKTISSPYCFAYLFTGCSSLVSAPKLPATTLSQGCYYGLFNNCTNLAEPPYLPARTLTEECYRSLFYGCSSLQTAPELPVMTLQPWCYRSMFYACSSLRTPPALPATTLAANCYSNMFVNSGITQAPVLPATRLYENSYYHMFDNCRSLYIAPALPATTLANNCYEGMFYGSAIIKGPSLPATTLVANCYYQMFMNCTSLRELEVSFSDWTSVTATTDWVKGITGSGTFVSISNTLPLETGDSRVPTNWIFKRVYTATMSLGGHASWDGTSRSDSTLSVLSFILPSVVADAGYTFVNWNTKSDGTGTVVGAPGTKVELSSDSTIYAYCIANWSDHISVLDWTADGVRIQSAESFSYIVTQVFQNASLSDMTQSRALTEYANAVDDCLIPGDAGVYVLRTYGSELIDNPGGVLSFSVRDASGNWIGTALVTIPLIVDGTHNISEYTASQCSSLDMYLLDGAVCTVDINRTCQNVKVLGGAKLVVPSGRTLTVASLTMQGGNINNGVYEFVYPQMVVNGNIVSATNKINYDYILNASQYYSLTLPYDVQLSDITYQDGSAAVAGKEGVATYDYKVRYYNGSTRTTGASGWASLPAATVKLNAGQGYTVYAKPKIIRIAGGASQRQKYATLRFPMSVDFSSSPEVQKVVSVTAYGQGDAGVRDNDKGWNLVGNPYLATLSSETGLTSNGIGLLVDDGMGGYEWSGTNRYVVIPSTNGKSYSQVLASDAVLPAFKNFFVQIGSGDALNFPLANRAQSVSARRYEAQEQDEEHLFEITLAGNTISDHVGFLLSDAFTPAYEINADLQKWFGEGLQVYALGAEDKLAYIATDMLNAQAITLGFIAPQNGEFTFSLTKNEVGEDIKSIVLYDTQTKISTNILQDSYTFNSNKGTFDNRFILSVDKNKDGVVTSLPLLLKDAEVQIYDVLGHYYGTSLNSLPKQNMYIIRNGDNCHKIWLD